MIGWLTTSRLFSLVMLVLGAASFLTASAHAQDSSQTIDLIQIDGVIDPASADYLRGRIEVAEDDGVHAAVIQIDTSGGLDIPLEELVADISNSSVPVAVWVAPRDARAASAGALLAYGADLMYMSELTEIGPITPLSLEGGLSTKLRRTADDRALASIKALANSSDRSVPWGDDVEATSSLTAVEAVNAGVADGIASTHPQLLAAMDGREVQIGGGGSVRLETWDKGSGRPSVRFRFQDMGLWQRTLHFVADPEIALWLLLAGIWGIIFELFNPGIGLAGIFGAGSLWLGFYALYVLPTNWLGVALIAAAMLLMLVDVQTAGFGVWTLAGVASLVVGGLVLFSGAEPELELSLWSIGAAVFATLVFFVSVMTAALRVRLRRPITGDDAIVGSIGEAQTDIAPEGTVVSEGTVWRARTMETGIAAGSKVKVMATEGLVLLVEPHHERVEQGTEAP